MEETYLRELWKQWENETSRLEEEIRKLRLDDEGDLLRTPDVENERRKLSLVFEYLLWVINRFPKTEDPRESPEVKAVRRIAGVLWDALHMVNP